MTVDITALAGTVRRLDVSATSRSFFAVLAPLSVLLNLAGVFAFLVALLEADFGFEEDGAFVASAAVMAIFAFAPLGFVVHDWLARREGWRHMSAIIGAAIGSLGFALIGVGIWFVGFMLEEAGIREEAPLAVVGAGLPALLGLAGWLLARSALVRGIGLAAAIAVLLAGFSPLVFGLIEDLGSGDAGVVEETVIPLLTTSMLLALGFWWFVRSVRLRIVLSSDRPRTLLLGDLQVKSIWARLAFLTGLPSSQWNAAALRTAAFWVFMISRPLVYAGFALAFSKALARFGAAVPLATGAALVVAGHFAFHLGKRLAARDIWRPQNPADSRPPVLFLRSFEDDQFSFKRPKWDLVGRWFDLWSFRRNADEALIDEIAQYGPVVALGQPDEKLAPFGALRHYASHDDWQATITETARRAQAIVIGAGDTPGVLWEYELLEREKLLDRTLLLFRPGKAADPDNRRALAAFPKQGAAGRRFDSVEDAQFVALLQTRNGPTLLTTRSAATTAYLIAMRAHFQKCDANDLADPSF